VALGWGIVVVLVADAGPGSKEYMHGLASHTTLELHSAALQLCTAKRGYMDNTGTHGAERAAGLAPIPNGVGLLKAITGARSILVQAALLRPGCGKILPAARYWPASPGDSGEHSMGSLDT
jgi:hypothetical protein